MSEISDFIFEANREILRKTFDERCKYYDPEFVKKIYHYENDKLMGLLIYFDWKGVRYILEGHYLGKNKFLFLKNWRNLFRDKNIHTFKSTIRNINIRVIEFYKKMNFKIIANDENNVYLELRR